VVRVVSLVPSVSETLVAWGVTPIAVTRFCEQPGIPAVGGTKNPDVDAIVALAPDLVVMNDEENRREDADALAAAGVALEVLTIESVADVAPALERLAARIGVARQRVRDTDSWGQGGSPPRCRAFIPIWRRPWMTMNARTYGSSLLETIGVVNVFAGATERYPTVTLEDAAAADPDVVLAPSEPYVFTEKHVPELSDVAPVVLVDGRDLFWWGWRTPAAVARMRNRLGA